MKNENQDLQVLQELTKKYTNPGVFANHVYKNIDIYKLDNILFFIPCCRNHHIKLIIC